jgi:putative ABC transport system permease protein
VTSFIVISVLVIITAFLGSKKAAKIEPVQAIRVGAPLKRFSKILLPRNMEASGLALPVMMGLRLLSASFGRSLSQGIIILITLFIIVFSINVSFSFESLKYNKPAWGFEDGDIQFNRRDNVIIGLTHVQLMEILLHEKAIHQIMPSSYASLSILSKDDLPVIEIYGKVYSDSLSHAGLLNLEGKHPQTSEEISLCIGTARQFRKKPGDSITVFIEGQKATFLVTGIYQDVSNLGQGFRLHENALKKLNPLYSPTIYSIKLKPHNNVDEYKNYLVKRLGETIAIDASIEERVEQMGIISEMKASLFALSFFFVLIMLLAMGSDLIISTKENLKHFGILKSIGWTPAQIRQSMVCKILCITGVALFLAIPMNLYLSPMLMGNITGGIGLINFPFIINYSGLLMTVPITLLLIAGFSWCLSRGASLINPRILIVS